MPPSPTYLTLLDIAMLAGVLALLFGHYRARKAMARRGLKVPLIGSSVGLVIAGTVVAADLIYAAAGSPASWADAGIAITVGGGGWIVLIGASILTFGFYWRALASLLRHASVAPREPMSVGGRDRTPADDTQLALEQLRMVTDAVPILFAYVDTDQRYRYANRAYEVWHGKPRSQIEGRHIRELMGDKDFAIVEDVVNLALAGEQAHWDGWIGSPTLGRRYVHASFVPDVDETGTVHGFTSAITDMTERHEIEESLEKSERLLSAVMDNVPVGISIRDLEGHYLLVNPKAERDILGEPEAQLIGRKSARTLPPDLAEEMQAMNRKVLKSGVPASREVEAHLAGQSETRLVIKFPIKSADNTIFGVGTIATDITAIKRAERAREESEARLRDVMANQSQLIGRLDRDGNYTFVNDAVCQIRGKSSEELIGTPMLDKSYIPTDRYEPTKAYFAGITKDNPTADIENPVYDSAGNLHWFRFTNKAIFDEQGELSEYQFSGEDITERKLAEDARHQAETKLQQVMDAVPVLISYIGSDLRYQMVNKAYERWFDLANEEIEGRHMREVIGDDAFIGLESELGTVLAGRPVTYEKQMNLPKIGERFVQGSFIPVADGADGPTGFIVVVTDITNSKRAEAALRRSEERYRAVVDSQSDLVGRWLPDGTRTFVNDAMCRFYGKAREELLGHSFFALVDQADRQHATDMVAGRAPAVPTVVVRRFPVGGNQIRWVQWVDTPIIDDTGTIVEFQSVGRDFTEQKLAEDQLRDSETRYRRLIETMNDGLIIQDDDHRIVFVNDKLLEILCVPSKDILGKSPSEFLDQEDLKQPRELQQSLIRGIGGNYAITYTRGDGSRCILGITSYPIMDGDGTYKGNWGIVQDVTEQKNAENALLASEKRLRIMSNAFPQHIAYVDANGRYQFVNSSQQKFFKRSMEEFVGRSIAEATGETHYAQVELQHTEALRGEQMSFEYHMSAGDDGGDIRAFQATYIPDIDDRGKVNGYFAISVDVTEHRQSEAALEQARLEAEQANRSKSRFLAAASHDLRQPLQGMRLLLHTLENTNDEQRRNRAVDGLGAALSVTSNLLDALLDISKLDAGVVQPEIDDVPVVELMKNMLARFAPEAEGYNIDLRIVPSALYLRTDPILLERIVGNFMSNALKYSDGKKILLGCRRKGDHLKIEVCDQGAGIPPEEQEKIFEEFYQYGRQRTDSNKGLGLGLAIATRLGYLLGHELGLRSTVGKGSAFSICVPIAESGGMPHQELERQDAVA